MRPRRLIGVVTVVLACGAGVTGASASIARYAGNVTGITIHAPFNTVELNVGLWGFFVKPGVNCSDFSPASVPNPAVRFGALTVSSHPENGRAGCLVTASTIKFVKPGRIPFRITLTETGAFSGTDTILDTALVTPSIGPSVVTQAKTLIHDAMTNEDEAKTYLFDFTTLQVVSAIARAVSYADQAASDLSSALKLTLPGPDAGLARGQIALAAADDRVAAHLADQALHETSSTMRKTLVRRARTVLARAKGEKLAALKDLG